MAEQLSSNFRRWSYFFLYDGSKVRSEGDLTREGICYFYPEETPLDQQELICGQLAGVSRCVSELSSSPVRLLRLRRHKFAIHLKDELFWALGCPVEVPSVSICQLLDQLINLFSFYNGSINLSYQLHSRDVLAARWAQYLSHLQSASTDLHHIFSCLKTIDAASVDPLLLLKAALILQACQRCPLVLAGSIFFRGRVVSTQMSPQLTMKVMVHERETYMQAQKEGEARSSGPLGGVSSTSVFLTASELQHLQLTPFNRDLHSQLAPAGDAQPQRPRLSRTLSDVPSAESQPSHPATSDLSDNSVPPAGPHGADDLPGRPSQLFPNGKQEAEEKAVPSRRRSGSEAQDAAQTCSSAAAAATLQLNGGGQGTEAGSCDGKGAGSAAQPLGSGGSGGPDGSLLVPMTLYLHRVKGLVLALLVEPRFLDDSASMEEVFHSSLASLNGLEAHLRTTGPGPPGTLGPPGLYSFAHFDGIQSTLTTNLSAGGGAGPQRPFVRAAALLHSHFCTTETLQEAIIRSASAAVYGTRTLAHETFFQQHGGALRNSGVPNHQDSAFSLPSKARHRLQKHGVNLL
uniref:HPS4 biogenesis of lysosomal organelles complex 3 subunit 2 n=1 Tax=Tetraodon nigroviridis TaxID=99883 RepID=H3D1N3_TETNG